MDKKPFLFISEPFLFPVEAKAILAPYVRFMWGASSRSEFIRKAKKANILWVRLKHRIDKDVLSPKHRIERIVSPTTGLTHIDLEEAQRQGISVMSLQGETAFLKSISSTAECTIGLILSLLRRFPGAVTHVQMGGWNRNLYLGRQASNLTLGILGLGRVGKIVAKMGKPLFREILAYDINPHVKSGGVKNVNIKFLLRHSDIVSVHINETSQNNLFLNRGKLAMMKRGAYLINTSRGSVLDERALLAFLTSKRIAGAALDVLSGECEASFAPLKNALVRYSRAHQNVIVTPHLGGATTDALCAVEIFMAKRLVKALSRRRISEVCR